MVNIITKCQNVYLNTSLDQKQLSSLKSYKIFYTFNTVDMYHDIFGA